MSPVRYRGFRRRDHLASQLRREPGDLLRRAIREGRAVHARTLLPPPVLVELPPPPASWRTADVYPDTRQS